MASSVSGQDEPNRTLWLATRAGKMEPSCPLGTTRCIPQAKFHQKPYNKSFIDQVCSVKMAGYWPRSFFASLWTSTSARSINTQKKNLANIQPSWPHTWSITHTSEAANMAEQLRDFAQFNGHQELSLALSKVNDILNDIKLRKPKQQTLISNYFSPMTNRFKRETQKIRSISFSNDRP